MPNSTSPDVVVLGAGFAGISAALDLAREGLQVEILEARDRLGGRVFTRYDSAINHAVDLGAEFVHGLAPEIWLPLQEHHLEVIEVEGDFWCSTNGVLERCRFFKDVEQILAKMDDKSPDQSFLDFLHREFGDSGDDEAKRHAIGYVSGFNAADPAQVSVHWLVHGRDAEEQLQGDRGFRIVGGYRPLLQIFSDELSARNIHVRLRHTVREVRWKAGSVSIAVSSPAGDQTLATPRALVTFPLSILQDAVLANSARLRFTPQLPAEKATALQKLCMGKVVRVVLCFRRRVWENTSAGRETLANMSFLFSDDQIFPTWWTQSPDLAPMITGWAPARSADFLQGMSAGRIVDKAVESLSSVLRIEKAQLQSELVSAHFHDWDSDPFSRGAYSYVKAGGEGCQAMLGAPLDGTLFFAGEATDVSGNNGTVHAAIASGKRAAKEILAAFARES
jgi:monoamine oxidase